MNAPRIPRWHEGVSVGDVAIDIQHAEIFSQIGRTAQAMERRDAPLIRDEIERLQAMLIAHTASEERTFINSDYPHVETHRIEHQVIIHMVQALRDAVALSPDPEALIVALSHLAQSLIEHLVAHDSGYRPFICTASPNAD